MTTTRFHLRKGDHGTADTLDRMRRLVNSALLAPSVIETAHEIVRNAPPRDELAQAARLLVWMKQHFRFRRDPVGVELLRDPEYQLTQIKQTGTMTGDCDDAAVLSAALGKALGFPARFCVVALNGTADPYQHVYTVLTTKAGPFRMDTTADPTKRKPRVKRKAYFGV